LQIMSVSEHFKGFIRTDRPQVEQEELRSPDRGWTSCLASIRKTSCFTNRPSMGGTHPKTRSW